MFMEPCDPGTRVRCHGPAATVDCQTVLRPPVRANLVAHEGLALLWARARFRWN